MRLVDGDYRARSGRSQGVEGYSASHDRQHRVHALDCAVRHLARIEVVVDDDIGESAEFDRSKILLVFGEPAPAQPAEM